jgi:hypothetical protein
MASIERQAAIDLDKASFLICVPKDGMDPLISSLRRGDTIIVRDINQTDAGDYILRLVTEDAIRAVATNLLVD